MLSSTLLYVLGYCCCYSSAAASLRLLTGAHSLYAVLYIRPLYRSYMSYLASYCAFFSIGFGIASSTGFDTNVCRRCCCWATPVIAAPLCIVLPFTIVVGTPLCTTVFVPDTTTLLVGFCEPPSYVVLSGEKGAVFVVSKPALIAADSSGSIVLGEI
uniref:Uncharacterized protein n=1 Tax=Lygus hesperus TaxID=30085 RepID=A0A146KSM8_LYGHE